MKKRKKKKLKIHYGRIFLALLILGFFLYMIISFVRFPIRNIYIYHNTILSDQEIIDLAGLQNYPSIFSMTSREIEKKLEKNIYIKNATIKKKKLKEIHIEIEENYVLFYDSTKNVSVLKDGSQSKEISDGPYLVNYITDTLYDEFISKMQLIDRTIINRVSEIKYDPNSVDEERFLFTMNDGNYVYLTLTSFKKINNYVDILKNFENQKGILYLDYGEYFQVLE